MHDAPETTRGGAAPAVRTAHVAEVSFGKLVHKRNGPVISGVEHGITARAASLDGDRPPLDVYDMCRPDLLVPIEANPQRLVEGWAQEQGALVIVPVIRASRTSGLKRTFVIAARIRAYPESGTGQGGRTATMLRAWAVEGDEWCRTASGLLPVLADRLAAEPELVTVPASQRFERPVLEVACPLPAATRVRDVPAAAWVMLDGISRGAPTFWSKHTFPDEEGRSGERKFLETLAIVTLLLPDTVRAPALLSASSGLALGSQNFLVNFVRDGGPFDEERAAVPPRLAALRPDDLLATLAARAGEGLRAGGKAERISLGHVGADRLGWSVQGLQVATQLYRDGKPPAPAASAARRVRETGRRLAAAVGLDASDMRRIRQLADWSPDRRAQEGDDGGRSGVASSLRRLSSMAGRSLVSRVDDVQLPPEMDILRFATNLLGQLPPIGRPASGAAAQPFDRETVELLVKALHDLSAEKAGRPSLDELLAHAPELDSSDLGRLARRRLFVLASFRSRQVERSLRACRAPAALTDVAPMLELLGSVPDGAGPFARDLDETIDEWTLAHLAELGVMDPGEVDLIVACERFRSIERLFDGEEEAIAANERAMRALECSMAVVEADTSADDVGAGVRLPQRHARDWLAWRLRHTRRPADLDPIRQEAAIALVRRVVAGHVQSCATARLDGLLRTLTGRRGGLSPLVKPVAELRALVAPRSPDDAEFVEERQFLELLESYLDAGPGIGHRASFKVPPRQPV